MESVDSGKYQNFLQVKYKQLCMTENYTTEQNIALYLAMLQPYAIASMVWPPAFVYLARQFAFNMCDHILFQWLRQSDVVQPTLAIVQPHLQWYKRPLQPLWCGKFLVLAWMSICLAWFIHMLQGDLPICSSWACPIYIGLSSVLA